MAVAAAAGPLYHPRAPPTLLSGSSSTTPTKPPGLTTHPPSRTTTASCDPLWTRWCRITWNAATCGSDIFQFLSSEPRKVSR